MKESDKLCSVISQIHFMSLQVVVVNVKPCINWFIIRPIIPLIYKSLDVFLCIDRANLMLFVEMAK